jgi:hypothetical protein
MIIFPWNSSSNSGEFLHTERHRSSYCPRPVVTLVVIRSTDSADRVAQRLLHTLQNHGLKPQITHIQTEEDATADVLEQLDPQPDIVYDEVNDTVVNPEILEVSARLKKYFLQLGRWCRASFRLRQELKSWLRQ